MFGRAVLLAVTMVVISPAGAPAQFTSVITQPKKAEPTVAAPAVAGQPTDSSRATQMADMHAWVDSAAGALGVARPVTTDSAAPLPTAPAHVTTTAVAHGEVGSMSTGVRAPDTASTLPLIALLGAVILSAGTFLLSTRPRRAEKQATVKTRV